MARDAIAPGPKGPGLRTTSIRAACGAAAVLACFACTGRPAELAVNGRTNAQPSITASGRFVWRGSMQCQWTAGSLRRDNRFRRRVFRGMCG
jgi:hypothetical protein